MDNDELLKTIGKTYKKFFEIKGERVWVGWILFN
jgi:hypothetical protein